MSDIIQQKTDFGHFDLHIGDLQVMSDSFGPGAPTMQCPSGTTPRRQTASCVGCPKGQYSVAGRCKECPIGTYQNSTNKMDCEPCPGNTNTTETGAENISQCLAYCAAGEFSPNGLAPCTKCPSNSYQPNAKSSACIKCNDNERTPTDGTTSETQCKKFDLLLSKSGAKIEMNGTQDVITVFMWVYISNVKIPTAFEITNQTSSRLSLKLTPTISFMQSRKEVETAGTISPSRWTNIAFSIDKLSTELTLYINGNISYKNTTLNMSDPHILEQGDFIGLEGDMRVSAFYVLPRKASGSEIASWASTCTPSVTEVLASMDDLSEVGNVTVIIPSACDAVDECVSSPCGIHKCFNKLNDYECVCTGGFSGLQCEIPPDFCKNSNCKNGATCVNGATNYTCQCSYGFSGVLCGRKAVDGQWSDWTIWSSCSKSCSGGIATRKRRCDSPPPDPEGVKCAGNSTDSKSCKEQKCPECSRLRRTYGLIITCNETSDLRRCTISCRAGLYFTNPPLAYYECGVATGYKWNHQNEENPTGRLPSCSELQPPVDISIEFDGHYDSVPCTESGKKVLKDSLETKMSTIDCRKSGTCKTYVNEPKCEISRRKRATGSSMTVTVGIHATVNSEADSLNVASLLQNNTAPSNELLELVNKTLELEKSAQDLMNNSVDFFQVTFDGTEHSLAPGTETLTSRPSTRCPSGTVPFEVFCAECPVGSYSDGETVTMCPRGQYQDTKGQTTCKQCPLGKTTVGIGSIHVSECSVSVTSAKSNNDNESGSVNNGVIIGIGVSVALSVLIITAVAATFLLKHYNRKRHRVHDSMFDLHFSGNFNIPSKPVFEKHLLGTGDHEKE